MKTPKFKSQELAKLVGDAVASGRYRILPHARQRCSERDVSVPDIENALEKGHHVPRRDRYSEESQDWSYCFQGAAVDGEDLRVVVAFDEWMLVVTVIRLAGRED